MTGDKINFGIRGKFGQIDPSDFKAGIRQGWQRRADDNIDAIFDKLDQNKNGILEQNELDTLLQQLGKYSKDSKITQREAKKILQGLDLKNIDEKVLFELLKQMNKESKGISSSSDTDNDGLIDSITYNKNEQGTVRTLNFDAQGNLTSSIYQQDDSKEVYDGSGNLLKEETVDESGQKVTKEYTYDNAGNKIGEKISASDGSVTEIKYGADGKKIEEKTTKDNTTTTIKYNATTGEQESKTVQKGAVIEHYDEKNNLTKKETDKGQGLKETIEYEYNESGDCVKETKTSPDGIKTIKEGDKVTVIQPDGSKEVTENGKTQKFDKDGNLINENQQSVNNAFKNGVAKVKIEGKATGLTSNDYEGELRLPKGATVQDGSYPQELRMTLPSGYGENATMKLKLIDAENGIYSTSTGDRNFQLVADENGNISVKAVNVEELQSKLDANLESYRKIAEEKQAALEESQIKQQNVANQKLWVEGSSIAKNLYEDMDGLGTKSTFADNLSKINKDNVASVVLSYRDISPDESLAEAIFDETGMSAEERRSYVSQIFNNLVQKAEELGIDTQSYKEKFEAQIKTATTFGSDKFDDLFAGLASGIIAKSSFNVKDAKHLATMSETEKHNSAMKTLSSIVENAETSFDSQVKSDGWAGKTVDAMSILWASDNRKEVVKEDIQAYKEQIQQLKDAKSEEEFKTKFKEIFGIDYDPEMVLMYQKKSEQRQLANATYAIEQTFNENLKVLLERPQLSNETKYVPSSAGPGYYMETASTEAVFNREFNAFAEFIGQGDIEAGKQELQQLFTDKGLADDASMEQKYQVLHEFAKQYSNYLHNNVLQATDNKGYDAFNRECEAMYNATYGLENDIAKRVEEYNVSQQTGAMVLKSLTKAGATLALCAIPGVGLVAASVGTAAISATVDLSDRATSEIGLQEGEVGQILKNAAIDGATVFAGGQLTKMLSNASTFVKIGGNMLGDVAVGAATEKLQTGTITLNGVVLQCVFSAAGNLVSLKQLKNVDANLPNSPKGPDINANLNGRDIINDAELVRNVDLGGSSAQTRKMVQEALDDIPTPAEVDAFARSLGEAPTPEQKLAIIENNKKAAAAYAKAHSIGDNLSDDVVAKLMQSTTDAPVITGSSVKSTPKPEVVALENDIKGINGTIERIEKQIAGAKKMGKNTSSLEQMLETNKAKLQAKTQELAALNAPVTPKVDVDAPSGNKPAQVDSPVSSANSSGLKRPDLDKYSLKTNAGSKVQVTAQTYKQMEEYVEKVYQDAIKNGANPMDARMHAIRAQSAIEENMEHFAWVKSRPDLFGPNMIDGGTSSVWSYFEPADQHHGAWKMHLYSVDESDWRKMCDVLIPYLKEHDIDWKTFNALNGADCLDGSSQLGKAFTIYPKDNINMEQIARDLDYIIKNNDLSLNNTRIDGDRALGNNGRTFYRYEYNSGQYKDQILDLANRSDRNKYSALYEGNRGGNNYLASDMTSADDPWLYFDPSNPNSRPRF